MKTPTDKLYDKIIIVLFSIIIIPLLFLLYPVVVYLLDKI